MVVVDPPGKAFDAALGLGAIGDLRGHVGQLGALAAHDATDERGQRLQVSGEVPGGRRRRGVREGVADGTITAKVVTHRRRLLLGGACWMVYKYQTKSFLTQCWYNTSSTSNRFSWRIPYDLMRC